MIATYEYLVTIMDPNVEPASGDREPTPYLRQIAWRGTADSRGEARQLADGQWDRTYGAGTQPANAVVSFRILDPLGQAAADWLERFIRLYEGIDTGPGDPVHDARETASKFLEAGPTRSDPFVVAGMIAEALPNDPRAASLAGDWNKLAADWSREYARGVRGSG